MTTIWELLTESSSLPEDSDTWDHFNSLGRQIIIDSLRIQIEDDTVNIAVPSDILSASLLDDRLDTSIQLATLSLGIDTSDIVADLQDDTLTITISGCTTVIPEGKLMIKIAAENVGGHRIVTIDSVGNILHADSDLILDGKKAIGMTTQSALAGSQCIIAISGDEVTEPSWAWDTSKPIYLGDNGVMTQTAPTVGFVLIVGVVLSPTSIRVRIEMPIFL